MSAGEPVDLPSKGWATSARCCPPERNGRFPSDDSVAAIPSERLRASLPEHQEFTATERVAHWYSPLRYDGASD